MANNVKGANLIPEGGSLADNVQNINPAAPVTKASAAKVPTKDLTNAKELAKMTHGDAHIVGGERRG